MSRERDVLREMIAQREEVIKVNCELLDRLYQMYGINIPLNRRDELHAENANVYNELLLLKTVMLEADKEVDVDGILSEVREKFGVERTDL